MIDFGISGHFQKENNGVSLILMKIHFHSSTLTLYQHYYSFTLFQKDIDRHEVTKISIYIYNFHNT